MDYQKRISEIEAEIVKFDFARLMRMERVQLFQTQMQNELSEIHDAVLTLKGEKTCLKKLVSEKIKE